MCGRCYPWHVVSYKYVTSEKDGIIYMIRYNNDGTSEEVEVGKVATEDEADKN